MRVPLSVNVTQPFRALQVDVRYDPAAMRATSVRLAPAVAHALLQANLSVPGSVRLALASIDALQGGAVATLEFESVGAQPRVARVTRAAIGTR